MLFRLVNNRESLCASLLNSMSNDFLLTMDGGLLPLSPFPEPVAVRSRVLAASSDALELISVSLVITFDTLSPTPFNNPLKLLLLPTVFGKHPSIRGDPGPSSLSPLFSESFDWDALFVWAVWW